MRLGLCLLALSATTPAAVRAEPLTFEALALMNGWHANIEGARAPAVAIDANDVVHLRGAMSQGGSDVPQPFVLPPKYRPTTDVLLPITVGSAKPGRLTIHPDGTTEVAAGSVYPHAQSLTSLEGVSFAK
jgi:hypothetical protein